MVREISLDEIRDYRSFIISYKTKSPMVKDIISVLGYFYWTTKDFGEWLNAVNIFVNKTLQGKCSWHQFKELTPTATKFLQAIKRYAKKHDL